MMNTNIVDEIINTVAIPAGFQESLVRNVEHDGDPIYWARFSKYGKVDEFGGEHFSVTYDAKNKLLKGYMHLDQRFDTDELPSEEEAKEIALNFIEKHAPDMIGNIEVRWIRPLRKIPENPPHDQGFALKSGHIITGVRVKLWNIAKQKFAWVIVGKGGEVISFERDISWDFEKKFRITERWLHDSWLEDKQISLDSDQSSYAVS
jgi:hypothetical protein